MVILAFDHFFHQDLVAIRRRLPPGAALHILPYQRVRRLAARSFPSSAFVGLEAAFDPALERCRRAYEPAATSLARWLIAAYRPSVFVVPSDTFFYLRPLIESFDSLGIPTVVVQKETTISPMTMAHHSVALGRHAPFISRVMTVCSERQKQFWVRASVQAEQIVVTGQPRFDVYADAARNPTGGGRRRSLLYLSYDDRAYLTSGSAQTLAGSWQQMRLETEAVLSRHAETGRWAVVAKRHPQQRPGDTALGPAVQIADRDSDTRALIQAADVVVGFQTTALFEAVVCGRPVVYPAWGSVFEQTQDELIPFHRHGDAVLHVRSPDELDHVLLSEDALPPPAPSARRFAEEHLGPVDGHAAERVIEVLRLHQRAAAHVPAVSPGSVVAAAVRGIGGLGLESASSLLRVARPNLARGVRRRGTQWRQEGRELVAIASGRLLRSGRP